MYNTLKRLETPGYITALITTYGDTFCQLAKEKPKLQNSHGASQASDTFASALLLATA